MTEATEPRDNGYIADFLRESIDHFMALLDVEERTSEAHEDKVHYEEWVRYIVVALVADVLAVGCGVSDNNTDAINRGVPDLLDRALPVLPVDAEFIGEVMSRLPGHDRMEIVADRPGVLDDRSLADHAKETFNAALYRTLWLDKQ